MEQKSLATRTRRMTEQDIPSGVRLNTLAGWNQTAVDWQWFLQCSPSGCFVTEVASQVVGTAATICYENRFAWIGMVLVDPEFRKAGIGTSLLHTTIEHLDRMGIAAIKLDATSLGKPIYSKLGFVSEYEVERWTLARPPSNLLPPAAVSGAILNDTSLSQICAVDRQLFGADRSFLLRSLHQQAPELTNVVWKSGTPRGYAFGRKGRFADHLGPWIAADNQAAQELFHSFLQHSSRDTIIVDCLPSNPAPLDMVKRAGFAFSRPLTRMVRGPNTCPGNPQSVCAILGPEFG